MHYGLVMLQIFLLLALCMLLGRRLMQAGPKSIQDSIGFYVSPILGLAVLVLISTLYGWCFAFRFNYSVIIAFLLAGFSFYYEPKKRACVSAWVQISLFAIICALPILAPIIRHGGYNPFTDIFTYLAQGQWLQTHVFSEPALANGQHPVLTQIELYQQTGSRMGGSFLLAYVQSLFHITWSYHAYIQTVALAFVAGCLAIAGVIRQVIAVPKWVLLCLALLPAASMNGFVFGAEWGFFPQTLGLALAIGLAALLPGFVQFLMQEQQGVISKIVWWTLPSAVCAAALLLAYNEPFPIFAAALALFFLIIGLLYPQRIRVLLFFVFVFALETALLVNYEGLRIFNNLYQTLSISSGKAAIGWPVLWSPIQFLAHAFGMKSPFQSGQFALDYWVSVYIFPMVIIGLMIFIYKSRKARSSPISLTVLFLVCMDLVFLFVFLKFRYLSESPGAPEIGQTFLQFKIAKYAALFSLSLLGIGFAVIWDYYKKSRVALAYIYLLCVVVGLCVHIFSMSRAFTNNFLEEVQANQAPFEKLLQLREALAFISANETIYVGLGPQHSKLRQMVAYVLYDRQIAGDYRDDGYLLGKLPERDRNMPLEGNPWLLTIPISSSHCRHQKNIMGPFVLQKAPFDYMALLDRQGGYNTESNAKGEVWNWVDEGIDFHFQKIGKSQQMQVKFQVRTQIEPRIYTVELRDKNGRVFERYRLKKSKQEQSFATPWIASPKEPFVVHIEADGKPVRLSKRDSRAAKFMLSNMSICGQ